LNAIAEILVIAALIAMNALFVAAEIALVSIRRSRIDQLSAEGNRGARRVGRLLDQPARFLAVLQIGITFIGFLASAYAAVSLTVGFQDWLATVPSMAPYAGAIALLVVTALVSIATIVFGELVPKTLALSHPERVALASARPVDLLARLLAPVVSFLTWATRSLTGPFGGARPDRTAISVEELRILVERGGEEGVLEAEEEQMISAVMELGEGHIHEVMVPRIAITAISADATFEQAIDVIIREGHSRIPAFDGSKDNVVGILYAKDLLPYLKGGDNRPTLRSILRPPLFIPESMSVDDLLHEFQRRKVHIAIVLDEYAGTAGLVTIEDLLEEIVGEIQDEYDVEEPMVVRLSDSEARLDGRANIDDLVDLYGLDLEGEDREEYDTVGGLVYHHVGGVPKVGESIHVGDVTLTVESTVGRRVGKVLARRNRAVDEGEPETAEAER
jgi:putative hemolysin